jgi:hypothetical protein
MRGGEKGQALPLAIVALAGLGDLYACDAGVEHAIWSLTSGGLAGAFSGPGDQLSYQLDEAVNGRTVTVTITANATSGGGPGEIEDAIIDSRVFEDGSASDPAIVHVSGDVYAVAYEGSSRHGSPGYLKTMTITPDGRISVPIDTFEFDSNQAATPAIIHVSGDVYAIAYTRSGHHDSPGYLKTVSISASGQISSHVIDALTFDSSLGETPDIVHVSGDIFAIAYTGGGYYYGSPGYLETVSIAADGSVGNRIIDSMTFEGYQAFTPDITHVAGDVYAIAYRSSSFFSSSGELKTVDISADGQIVNYVIDTLVFDTTQGATPRIIPVAGDVFAIAYTGGGYFFGSPGCLKTVSIAADGDIGESAIDSFEFDSSSGSEPSITFVAGDTYAIAYRGPSNDGFLKTVNIAGDGDIAGGAADTLEFDTAGAYQPEIIGIPGDVFAIAYRGASSQGCIKTVGISAGGAEAAFEVLAAAGERSVRTMVDIDGTAASIVSWRIE